MDAVLLRWRDHSRRLTRTDPAYTLAVFVEVDPRKLGRRIDGAPVVSAERAADFPGALALGAVSDPEGRQRVRELAGGLGLDEGKDFIAVA